MNLLLIDTATAACSVAVARGIDVSRYLSCSDYAADCTVHECWDLAPRQHAALILPMIERVLSQAELTLHDIGLIAFTTGCGSFMGVRTAAAVVQGISFAHNIPTLAVSTLQVLAQYAASLQAVDFVLSILDARMGEVYCGLYRADQQGVMQAVTEDQLLAPADVQLPSHAMINQQRIALRDVIGVGDGLQSYHEVLKDLALRQINVELLPHASSMLAFTLQAYQAGRHSLAQEGAFPCYLRNQVAHKPASKNA